MTRVSNFGQAPVVVIGSGPSGAIAARELTSFGAHVVMLEAGLRPPRGLIIRAAGHTLLRWRSQRDLLLERHVSLGDPATEWKSSMSPGGLSNYWTAAVPRFAPEDFTEGGRLDERFVWPIRYEELVPFYEIAEDLLTISGPTTSLPMLPAGRVRYPTTMPRDWADVAAASSTERFTSLPIARGGPWLIARRGSEFNSYQVIVKPLESSASFELRLGMQATRIIVSAGSGAATGVEYIDRHTGAVSVMPARGVILAAGAIDSTRILLASTSSFAARGLGNDNGLVGCYLHDHPKEWWVAEFEKPLPLVAHPVYVARRPYAGSEPLTGTSATIGRAASWQRSMEWAHVKGRRFGVQIFGTMVPDDSVGVQLLTDEAGTALHPKVGLRIRYHERDLATLRDAQEQFQSLFADTGHPVRVIPEPWIPRPGSSVHYAGSVRMHEDQRFGVLDRWNRIHGTPNVAVVDLSSFTTNPEKNPTLTAMALAGRAARHLVDTLQ